MLLVFADRAEMIRQAGPPGAIEAMAELGVYQGAFAQHCHEVLRPARYSLIDFWDYHRYAFVLEDAPQMRGLRAVYGSYFGPDPARALAEAERMVRERFRDVPGVEILKLDIAEAAARFADASLDLIYLDGNHTYEYVLRDLLSWWPKLRPGGLFVCNDFFESEWAARQNIGVIPAWTTFSRRVAAVHPIALGAGEWADFYFSNRPDSPLIRRFTRGLIAAGHSVVEIAEEAIPLFHHRLVELEGGSQRLIPVLRAGAA